MKLEKNVENKKSILEEKIDKMKKEKVFIYGVDTDNSKTFNEAAYHEKGKSDSNEAASSGQQAGENFIPVDCNFGCWNYFAAIDSSVGNAYARQLI